MRREDYQPKKARNEALLTFFDVSCVKCSSVKLKIITEFECPDVTPLDWYPVSREVSNVRNENPDLIRPVPLERELF